MHAVRGERSAYRPVVSRLVDGCEPLAVAAALLRAAGDRAPPVLYVADLDAILGGDPQRELLGALLAATPDLLLWLDAGFAHPDAAARLCDALGADGARVRPVFGSESLDSTRALDALAGVPGAILSLDRRGALPLDPAGAWSRPGAWPDTVIVMTLDRVGSAAGPDLERLSQVRAIAPGRTWVGAGGVRSEADLAAAGAAGADAWLVASALHDGSLRRV